MKRLFIFAVIVMMAATGIFAQSKISNRTKIVVNEAKESRQAKTPSKAMIKSIGNVEYITVFVRFREEIDLTAIENVGGKVRAEYAASRTVTANVPVSAIERLATDDRIEYIEASQKMRIKMDKARDASNATKVIEGAAPLAQAFRGKGVIVGVVDQEIQVSHTNFWNRAKDRYRIKSFWNQNDDSGDGGFGYDYGTFYTDSASIVGEKYDVSNMSSGHATHVTGIAAGADTTLDYYGIASDADIVVVSTTAEDADLTDGVKYIFEYADSVEKPCVVNISMGSELGSHDGTDLCCQILDGLAGHGRVIIGAAGNSGSTDMHVTKTFTQTDTTVKTFIDIDGTYSYYYGKVALMDAWGEVGNDFEMAIVVYQSSGDTIVYSSPYVSASRDTSFTFNGNYSSGSKKAKFTADFAAGISALNNKPNVSVQYEETNVSSGLYVGVMLRGDAGRVDMWCNDYFSTFTDNGFASKGWESGDDDMTIGTGIGEAKKVVAVGSYVNRVESSTTVGDISHFSSKGPTTDGRLKPEITAPGEGIYSSIPDLVTYWYDTESTKVGGKKYYFAEMSGTSMACPYVTGVVATWLQANPHLGYDELIDVFKHTAKRDQYTGTALPDNTWGYGKIDAYEGIMYIIAHSDVEDVTEHQIVAVYPNPTEGEFNVGFASADKDVVVTVYDLGGRAVVVTALGDVEGGEERRLSIGDAPDGIYMVRIAGERHSNCYKIVKQ